MSAIYLVYSDILKSTKTVSQKEQLVEDVDSLLTSLFHEEKNSFEKALKSVKFEISQIIRDEFLNKAEGKEMIKDFLTQLKERAEKLRTIKIVLAISPSENTIDVIYDWISKPSTDSVRGKNVNDGYVLDIQTDESIIGGAMISFEGRYIDSTLKKTLDQTFKDRRHEIISPLSKI